MPFTVPLNIETLSTLKEHLSKYLNTTSRSLTFVIVDPSTYETVFSFSHNSKVQMKIYNKLFMLISSTPSSWLWTFIGSYPPCLQLCSPSCPPRQTCLVALVKKNCIRQHTTHLPYLTIWKNSSLVWRHPPHIRPLKIQSLYKDS